MALVPEMTMPRPSSTPRARRCRDWPARAGARAVALGVGHRDAERQVFVLHVAQVLGEARAVLGAAECVVQARTGLAEGVERVVRQVALRAAGLLAQHTHRLELVEQVAGGFVDVQHARHAAAAAGLERRHQRRQRGVAREVVADAERGDAGLQRGLVGHRFDAAAIDVDQRPQAAQRLAVVGGGHRERRGGCVRRVCGRWCVHRHLRHRWRGFEQRSMPWTSAASLAYSGRVDSSDTRWLR
jgi:hypothetical protein